MNDLKSCIWLYLKKSVQNRISFICIHHILASLGRISTKINLRLTIQLLFTNWYSQIKIAYSINNINKFIHKDRNLKFHRSQAISYTNNLQMLSLFLL